MNSDFGNYLVLKNRFIKSLKHINFLFFSDSEEINICNVSFTAFDLGGHLVARRIWRNYYEGGMDAIVFIIDGSCKERFEEAKEELNVSARVLLLLAHLWLTVKESM